MLTPAILNLSSPASGQAAAAKSGPTAPNGAFNQMLSQQIAERRDAGKSVPARPAGQAGKTELKQAEAKPSAAKPDETKQSSENGSANEVANTRDSEEKTVEAATSTPSATELLAQMAGALIKPEPAAAAGAAANAAAGSAVMAVDATTVAGKQGLLAAADPDLQQEQATVRGEQTAFTGSLRHASEQQAALQQGAAPDNARSADTKASDKLLELPAAPRLQDTPAINATAPQMQAGALNTLQAAGAQMPDRLTPHVGSPAWDQALGQKVVWMVAGAQQSASLTLNPPDLGPLQVVLNVSNGQADASFYAAQPEVRQALEAALPKLRDMMSQAGVELGQTSVSAGMPQQHERPGNHAAHAQQAGHGATAAKGAGEAPLPLARTSQAVGGQGLVDTFA
ncbi:flagellar hook-length control protein FliK [Noviherbaspirillum sedimenti]|uniref:Flagellar hook-length control protein FliK n=1 Tax=Noviherbaspirillum sedimenti TaxID=2320865 RepID=A0A3A3FZR4_9BURK|nr:flagellar hook-length control protein FliK [Noviherbaspirillum sedimenti]RJG01164.1 flagellar hook-length control protein FliK [Noviherbaspirillum sedimenti]